MENGLKKAMPVKNNKTKTKVKVFGMFLGLAIVLGELLAHNVFIF